MLQIVAPTTMPFDWLIVLSAILVGFFAAIASIKLFRWAQDKGSAGRPLAVLIASGTAGGGIWSSHLAILAAYYPGVTLSFGAEFLLASLLVAIALSTISIAIGVYFPERLRWSAALIGLAIASAPVVAVHALPLASWPIFESNLTIASFFLVILVSFLFAGYGGNRWASHAIFGGLVLAIGFQHFAISRGIELSANHSTLLSLSLSRAGLESIVSVTIALMGLTIVFGPSLQGADSNRGRGRTR